jgi:hypothetical protein
METSTDSRTASSPVIVDSKSGTGAKISGKVRICCEVYLDLKPNDQHKFECWYHWIVKAMTTLRALFVDRPTIMRQENLDPQTESIVNRQLEPIDLDGNQGPQDFWTIPHLPDFNSRHHSFDLTSTDSNVRLKLV